MERLRGRSKSSGWEAFGKLQMAPVQIRWLFSLRSPQMEMVSTTASLANQGRVNRLMGSDGEEGQKNSRSGLRLAFSVRRSAPTPAYSGFGPYKVEALVTVPEVYLLQRCYNGISLYYSGAVFETLKNASF